MAQISSVTGADATVAGSLAGDVTVEGTVRGDVKGDIVHGCLPLKMAPASKAIAVTPRVMRSSPRLSGPTAQQDAVSYRKITSSARDAF
jgi:hypothetical protein